MASVPKEFARPSIAMNAAEPNDWIQITGGAIGGGCS